MFKTIAKITTASTALAVTASLGYAGFKVLTIGNVWNLYASDGLAFRIEAIQDTASTIGWAVFTTSAILLAVRKL